MKQTRGTARFALTVTESACCVQDDGHAEDSGCAGHAGGVEPAGRSEQEVFLPQASGCASQAVYLLTDAVEHTLCAYDREGRLSYVAYLRKR